MLVDLALLAPSSGDGRPIVGIASGLGVALFVCIAARRRVAGPLWVVGYLAVLGAAAAVCTRLAHYCYYGDAQFLKHGHQLAFRLDGQWSVLGLVYAMAIASIVCLVAGLRSTSVGHLSDIATVSALVGLAVGRVGCLLHGCCYGRPGSAGVLVTYAPGTAAWTEFGAAPLHAIPIYESLLCGVTAGVLMTVHRAGDVRPGLLAGSGAIVYGGWRLISATIRGDGPAGGVALFGVEAQALLILIIGGGSVILCARRLPDGRRGEHDRRGDWE